MIRHLEFIKANKGLSTIIFIVIMFFGHLIKATMSIGVDSDARARAMYPDKRYNDCLSIILDRTENLADAEAMCKHYRKGE